MASSVLLSVEPDRVSVSPGASVEFEVLVQNLTTLIDQVALRVEGIDSSWVQIVPPFVPVFAQSTARARVIITPASNAAMTTAGLYSLQISGKAQENAGAEGQTSAVIEIQPAGDYQLKLGPARAAGYQESAYALSVQNGANSPLRLHLSGADKNDALWYKFEPFQLQVAPGSAAAATLTVKAKKATAERQAIIFSVNASGEYQLHGAPVLVAPARQLAGQFVQAAPAALMLSINPGEVEGVTSGVFEVRFGTPGAVAVTVQLAAAGDSPGITLRLNPVMLSLGPQAEAAARLDVETAAVATGAGRTVHALRVRAETADGTAQAAESEARFVQVAAARKPFPWLWVFLLVLLALVFVCSVGLVIATRAGLFR